MSRRKTVTGLTVLCALLVSAFAAQAASAVGTTAYTCTKTGSATGENFSDAHCKTHSAGGEYKHVAIANGTPTNITGSDITTGTTHSGAVLKGTIFGSEVELVAKEVTGSGSMENKEVGGEMVATGTGKLKYSGVTENLLGCKVTGKPGGVGVVESKTLLTTTEGVGDQIRFVPEVEGLLAEFELTECIVGPITVKVFGNVLGKPDGATISTVHTTVTGAKNLRLLTKTGPVAGIEGTLTFSANGNPLSFTT